MRQDAFPSIPVVFLEWRYCIQRKLILQYWMIMRRTDNVACNGTLFMTVFPAKVYYCRSATSHTHAHSTTTTTAAISPPVSRRWYPTTSTIIGCICVRGVQPERRIGNIVEYKGQKLNRKIMTEDRRGRYTNTAKNCAQKLKQYTK